MKPSSPDTALWAEKRMRDLFAAKTPTERILMGMSMCDTARQVVMNAIELEWPQLSPAEKRVKFFERYLGPDLSPEHCARIAERIRKSFDSSTPGRSLT